MKPSTIGSYMVTSPYTVEPGVGLKTADIMMRGKEIRHLPVVKKDKLVGIVSERDLRAAMALPLADQLTIGDIMETNVHVATLNTSLAKVAQEMASKKLGSTLIVNDDDEVIGIFTTTDALRILAGFADDETIEDYLVEEEEYISWPWQQSVATT